MPGSNELFIIIAIFIVIFFLVPRMKKGNVKKADRSLPISGKMRLLILASIIWPALFAAILEPWKGEMLTFVYMGLAPVLLGWGTAWVAAGFKKNA